MPKKNVQPLVPAKGRRRGGTCLRRTEASRATALLAASERGAKAEAIARGRGIHLSAKKLGEMGELAFAVRATLLGMAVGKPYGETQPYDLLVDNGKKALKIQVRCKGLRCQEPYKVSCGHQRYNREGGYALSVPFEDGEVDILAIYLLEFSLWYLIPMRELRGKKYLRLHLGFGPWKEYEERWSVLMPKGKRTARVEIQACATEEVFWLTGGERSSLCGRGGRGLS